jgi:hypothetical protein
MSFSMTDFGQNPYRSPRGRIRIWATGTGGKLGSSRKKSWTVVGYGRLEVLDGAVDQFLARHYTQLRFLWKMIMLYVCRFRPTRGYPCARSVKTAPVIRLGKANLLTVETALICA